MVLYPITVTWLPCISTIGHSNDDGWGATDKLLAAYPDFTTVAGVGALSAKNNPVKAYWKNIYVFTSPQPFPGAGHTPATSNIGDGQWLEMTIANIRANGDPHPHAHPFNYPNNRGSCYPRFMYSAWDPTTFTNFSFTPSNSKTLGTLHGVEIPLMHFWRDFWQSQVGLLKVAFSSTLVLPLEGGPIDPNAWIDPFSTHSAVPNVPSAIDPTLGSPPGQYAYWNPALQFDWAPSTDRLFKLWYDKHVGAQAAIKAINPTFSMDIRMVVPWVGDNDSLTRNPTILQATWKNAILRLFQKMRDAIDANGWSSIPASEITFVCPGIYFAYQNQITPSFGSVDFCNKVLIDLAADDPRVVYVPSTNWQTLAVDGYVPVGTIGNTHFGHTGYVQAARDIIGAWTANQIGSWFDAISERDRMTLADVKALVKKTYDRGITQSDLSDALLVDYINQSLRSMTNHLGQLAWWLERRISVTLAFDAKGVAALPRHIAHPVQIESADDSSVEIPFSKIGRGDGGRILITFDENSKLANSTSTYRMAVISWPPDVTMDRQLVPFPKQFSDWLALEVCMRIASSGSNGAAQAIFAGRAAVERTRAQQVVGDERAAYRDRLHAYGQQRTRLGYGRF